MFPLQVRRRNHAMQVLTIALDSEMFGQHFYSASAISFSVFTRSSQICADDHWKWKNKIS